MCFIYISCGSVSLRKKCENLKKGKQIKKSRMDPEQIILDEDFDDGSTEGGYGEYDYLQQDKDALPVTPLEILKKHNQNARP